MEKTVSRGLGGKEKKEEFVVLKRIQEYLQQNKDIRSGTWTSKEIEVLNNYYLLSAKPMIYLINMSEKSYISKKNKFLISIKEWIDQRGNGEELIPFSVAFESKVKRSI